MLAEQEVPKVPDDGFADNQLTGPLTLVPITKELPAGPEIAIEPVAVELGGCGVTVRLIPGLSAPSALHCGDTFPEPLKWRFGPEMLSVPLPDIAALNGSPFIPTQSELQSKLAVNEPEAFRKIPVPPVMLALALAKCPFLLTLTDPAACSVLPSVRLKLKFPPPEIVKLPLGNEAILIPPFTMRVASPNVPTAVAFVNIIASPCAESA
jgi:hypothetical protein